MPHVTHTRGARRQRGAASLAVVVVLFFGIALAGAYANRNQLFEQRSASHQARSTQAFEAAQAGLDWALAQLNSGRIDDHCAPSASAIAPSFRQRYLAIDADLGTITPRLRSDAGPLWPACVHDGVDWQCHCPADGPSALAAPPGPGLHPAFRLRFVAVGGPRPGLVRIESNGCTRLADDCLDFPARAVNGEGRATVQALLALRPGLAEAPAATLTLRGALDVGGAALGVVNSEPTDSGLTVLAGAGVYLPGLRLQGQAGTPAPFTLRESDAALAALSADRLFAATFGTWPAVYAAQPAAVHLPCPPAGCAGAALRATVAAHPGRVFWVGGDLTLDSAGAIGSATDPVVLVVAGSLQFAAPVDVFGLVYARTANWASAGAGRIRGAAVAEGALSGNGEMDLVFDADILRRLRLHSGSFVQVPGSWRDFE